MQRTAVVKRILQHMKRNLTETLSKENKVTKVSEQSWAWEMVRSAAALYNSGGGTLRIGVEDDGTIIGGHVLSDYLPDHGKLAKILDKHLDIVPPFGSREIDNYIKVDFRSGVTAPSILKTALKHPRNPCDKYAYGTVFIRRMNGSQPSSEPPKTRSDWLTALHLWETNRGVTIQGQIIVQFVVHVNEWNPFDVSNTTVTHWKAKCLADVAKTLGRAKLADRLIQIVSEIKAATNDPKSQNNLDQEGSNYKQPIVEMLARLCIDLELSPPS